MYASIDAYGFPLKKKHANLEYAEEELPSIFLIVLAKCHPCLEV
jgi:hypothetical protein